MKPISVIDRTDPLIQYPQSKVQNPQVLRQTKKYLSLLRQSVKENVPVMLENGCRLRQNLVRGAKLRKHIFVIPLKLVRTWDKETCSLQSYLT